MIDISQYSHTSLSELQNDYTVIEKLYTNPPQVENTETGESYPLYVNSDVRFFENIPQKVTATEEIVQETEDTDKWIELLRTQLKEAGKNDITNGYVSTLKQFTNDEMVFDTTTYFNARSGLEQYQFKKLQQEQTQYTTSETFLAGITHTLIISPVESDTSYVIIGRNSKNKSTQSLQYNTAPAGLIEPHHLKQSLEDTIKEHFSEEAPEELLHNKFSFSEFKETLNSDNSDITITPTSCYIDDFSRSAEISTTVHIEGQLADFILETLNPNEEYSTVINYPIDIFGSSPEFPIEITEFTRQSRISLLLMLCHTYDKWELTNIPRN
jgi:hypothetical protein